MFSCGCWVFEAILGTLFTCYYNNQNHNHFSLVSCLKYLFILAASVSVSWFFCFLFNVGYKNDSIGIRAAMIDS